jgi:hypothetical protein
MRNDASPVSAQHWKEKILADKPQPTPGPVLEPVPKFGSDPLGWFQASVINLGRKSEGAKNTITAIAEGWDKHVQPAVNAAAEFTTGVVYQAIKNTIEPAGYVASLISPRAREDLAEAVRNIERSTLPDTNATRWGRIVGSLGSLIVSGIVFVKGGATLGGGTVACGTGILCAAGAPAIALGGVEMVAAGSVAVTSSKSLVEQVVAFSSNRAGNGQTDEVRSLIDDDARLVREAETAGKSHQNSLNRLVNQLFEGNRNPGIGTKRLFGNIFEARARDGARVYFRIGSDGAVEILAKSTKANQSRVINILMELYGK